MALVVQGDGAVQLSPAANTFVTVQEFRDFFENRGDPVAFELAEDEQIEAALIKATDYMAQRLRLIWKGSLVDGLQPLQWPRRGVDVPDFFDPFFRNVNVPVSFQDTLFIPENVIPIEVKDCQNFLARATIDDNGISSVQNLQETLDRTTRSEQVGDIKVEYFGAADGSDGGRITQFYYNAMRRVEPYLLPSAPHTGSAVRS